MLRPCCVEPFVIFCKCLKLQESACNATQHRIAGKEQTDIARNPYFMGISGGDLSRTHIKQLQ